jgi:hypothetical protein
MDVAKVDQDVAYVAMVVYIYCKLLSPMFHLFFQSYVARVFIWILHISHTYIASILSGCCVCSYNGFKCFSDVFASVSSIFICML